MTAKTRHQSNKAKTAARDKAHYPANKEEIAARRRTNRQSNKSSTHRPRDSS